MSKKGVTRVQSAKELDLRRYHAQVRKLKKLCEDNDVPLFTYDEAEDTMVCILSDSDYELGDTKPYCSKDHENYFITEGNLNKLHKKLQQND